MALRVYDNKGNFLHVYVNQIAMLTHNQIGFAVFTGSRKALEEVRHYIAEPSYNNYINLYRWNDIEDVQGQRFYCFQYSRENMDRHRFFFRKLGNSPYWQMTVLGIDAYNSCQDLVRGITMTEKERKEEFAGTIRSRALYFVLRVNDLFADDNAFQQYLEQTEAQMINTLMHNTYFIDCLYKKISLISPVPILREWMPALLAENANDWRHEFFTIERSRLRTIYHDASCIDKILVYKCLFESSKMTATIKLCLQNRQITTGSDVKRGKIDSANSLTAYLDTFSESLVRRAHQRFAPLYVPGISTPGQKAMNFFTGTKYHGNLNYFAAQRDTICAVAKGLQKNKRTLIVSECGSGKTAMALGSIYVHTAKKNPVSIVMCPGHMVEEWHKEIRRLYPFARAHIIERLSDIMPFTEEIRKKKNTHPLFLIMGKDSCKMDYEKRPYFLWNSRKMEYMTLDKKPVHVKALSDVKNELEKYAGLVTAFLKPGSKNTYIRPIVLKNEKDISYLDHYETADWFGVKYKKNRVNAWVAASDHNEEWVKVSKVGWVNKKLAQEFITALDMHTHTYGAQAKLSSAVLKAYDIAMTAVNGDSARPLIRCNVSEFIRRRLKHFVDYFIADEVHLYSSSTSAQGRAFANLVHTARHTIALTGTLLNGYAEDIFSMLFKLYSRTFIRNGFKYGDTREFAKEYGVIEEIAEYRNEAGVLKQTKQTTKFKPGISPLLFSKFLLDKAVFVTLSDITADLPNYHESPVAVEMDTETKTCYENFIQMSRDAIREHPESTEKYLFKMIQRMNTYPDQPYLQVPIFNNETGEQILCPPNINRAPGQKFYSNKDKKLLELVKKHKANGEKVLVYVYWINKIDCVTRIQNIFKENGITSAFLTASVSAREREKWIHSKMKEGTDVLICNPSLVETGLNLLEFTTIIFYQMGYNLFTMRQASRRSLRLNQSHDVTVYFLYFKDTIQESIISLMANKLQAAMAVEGKFSEEGINAMGDTDSILTQLANNLTKDIDVKLENGTFDFHTIKAQTSGNRFKNIDRDFMNHWLYPVAQTKKKPVVIDLAADLNLLRTGS